MATQARRLRDCIHWQRFTHRPRYVMSVVNNDWQWHELNHDVVASRLLCTRRLAVKTANMNPSQILQTSVQSQMLLINSLSTCKTSIPLYSWGNVNLSNVTICFVGLKCVPLSALDLFATKKYCTRARTFSRRYWRLQKLMHEDKSLRRLCDYFKKMKNIRNS
jgi:hypothetical protein